MTADETGPAVVRAATGDHTRDLLGQRLHRLAHQRPDRLPAQYRWENLPEQFPEAYREQADRELLPEVRELLDEPVAADARAGIAALEADLDARRAALHRDFLALWRELERKGFRARLEYAVTEGSHDLHARDGAGDIMPPAS